MPKSSRAATLNFSVSVSRRMPRVCGTSSITTSGGSSARAAITSSSGAAASRPSASRHESAIFCSPSTIRGGVRISLPAGGTAPPSTVAAARSRVAVATIDTLLPFTGAIMPPRMSCRRLPGRWRYSGSVTSASRPASSGRCTAASRTRCRASPAAMASGPSATCGGSVNTNSSPSRRAASGGCRPMRSVASSGRHCVSSRRATRTSVDSPCGTTTRSGSGATRAKVNRSIAANGAASRAQALAAAAGAIAARAAQAASGSPAATAQRPSRAGGVAAVKSTRRDCSATCATAASHRARDRAWPAAPVRTMSMMPRSSSPTVGNRRSISRATCSSDARPSPQRRIASGTARHAAIAARSTASRTTAGVSPSRSQRNTARKASATPQTARHTASRNLIRRTRLRNAVSRATRSAGSVIQPSRTWSGVGGGDWGVVMPNTPDGAKPAADHLSYRGGSSAATRRGPDGGCLRRGRGHRRFPGDRRGG